MKPRPVPYAVTPAGENYLAARVGMPAERRRKRSWPERVDASVSVADAARNAAATDRAAGLKLLLAARCGTRASSVSGVPADVQGRLRAAGHVRFELNARGFRWSLTSSGRAELGRMLREQAARDRLALTIVAEAFAAALEEVRRHVRLSNPNTLGDAFTARPRTHAEFALNRNMPTLRGLQ